MEAKNPLKPLCAGLLADLQRTARTAADIKSNAHSPKNKIPNSSPDPCAIAGRLTGARLPNRYPSPQSQEINALAGRLTGNKGPQPQKKLHLSLPLINLKGYPNN